MRLRPHQSACEPLFLICTLTLESVFGSSWAGCSNDISANLKQNVDGAHHQLAATDLEFVQSH